MLMKIFSMLSLSDLSNVILVCKKWKRVAESPWLWRRMEIVVGQLKVCVRKFQKEQFIQIIFKVTNMSILNTVRLRSVKRVKLLSRYHPDEEEAEAVFGAIMEHEAIRELNISQNQISRVNPDTLARVVNTMEAVRTRSKCQKREKYWNVANFTLFYKIIFFQVNLFNAKLSPAQVQALYTQISQGTRLRLVSMGHVDIR